ncbi:unnamed protein product [Closterium sp. Yama58-4]|nr:unnamed protein product [Closterium sp. Yama58-4]
MASRRPPASIHGVTGTKSESKAGVCRLSAQPLVLFFLLLIAIPFASPASDPNDGVDPCATLANKLEASVAALAKQNIIVDGSVGFATPTEARNCLRNFRFRADRDIPALDTIINALDNHYVYKHLAVKSPDPKLPSDVDIITYLKSIRATAEQGEGINSLLRFHTLIFRAIDSLNDGHTSMTSNCFYGVGLYTLPLPLVSVVEDGEQIIRVGSMELLRGRPDLIARGLFGFNFSRYEGKGVVTIEGEPALPFIARWADKYVGTFRSAGARLNAALAHRTVKGLGEIDGSQGAFTVRAIPPRKDALVMQIQVNSAAPAERVVVPWIADFPRGAFSDSRSYWLAFCRKAGEGDDVGGSTTEGSAAANNGGGGGGGADAADDISIVSGKARGDNNGVANNGGDSNGGDKLAKEKGELGISKAGGLRGFSIAVGSGGQKKRVPLADATVVGMLAPRRDLDPPPLRVREVGVVEEEGGSREGLNPVADGTAAAGGAGGSTVGDAAAGGGAIGAGATAVAPAAAPQQTVRLSAEGDLFPVLLLPDETAVVWLHTFSTKGLDISATGLTPSQYLYAESMRALSLATRRGKRIVLDVRGNSGGIIQTAYGVVRALVGPAKTPPGQLQMPQQLMIGNEYTARLIKSSATFFYNASNYCNVAETAGLKGPADFGPFQEIQYTEDGQPGNYSARVKLTEMLTLYDQSDDFSGLPMVVVSDGTCFSACAVLTHMLKRKFNVPMVTVGGLRDQPIAVSSSCLGGTLGSLDDGISLPLVGTPLANDPRATKPFRMQIDLAFAMLQAYGSEKADSQGVGGGSASQEIPCEFDFLEADAHIDLTMEMVDYPKCVILLAFDVKMDMKKLAMEHAAQMCPFLRNVSLSSSSAPLSSPLSHSLGDLCPASAALPGKKPIFEETSSSFEVAFRLFHGETGVVPLAKSSNIVSVKSGESNDGQISQSLSVIPALHASGITAEKKSSQSISTAKDTTNAFSMMGYETAEEQDQDVCPYAATFAGGLGASAATISLSVFGPSGPFSYDSFRSRGENSKEQQRRKEQEEKRRREEEASKERESVHEAEGEEWLTTGNCPIAKSYRAFSRVVPLIAAAIRPPAGIQYRCPAPIIALRAAVAKTPAMKALRPQALPIRTLAIGTIGMMLNIPLGVWREHCEKFSPQWIIAVHASVPLVAVLRKAALMPKYAMAFTIAASVIGQAIGARVERRRLKKLKEGAEGAELADTVSGGSIATTSSSSFKSAALPRLPQRSVMLSKARSESRAVRVGAAAAGAGSCKAAAGKEAVSALVSSMAVGAGGGASASSPLKVAAAAH